MRYTNWGDVFFYGAVGFLVLVLATGMIALAVDAVQDYRSFSAQADCRERGLEPMRRNFSTTVRCVRDKGYATDTTVVRTPDLSTPEAR